MTKLLIRVTKEVLEQSKYCSSYKDITMDDMDTCEEFVGANCAIACAIRSIFPNAWVDSTCIIPFAKGKTGLDIYHSVNDPRPGNYIELPQAASAFIRKFDGCDPVERTQLPEMEFEINIPDNVLEQLDISEITRSLENHSTL